MNGDIVTTNGCGCNGGNGAARMFSGDIITPGPYPAIGYGPASIPINGSGPRSIESFYDFQQSCPKNPLDLIAYASLTGTVGNLAFSTTFNAESWTDVGSLCSITTKPVITTLGTDNQLLVANALQWNSDHQTWNSDPVLPFPLRRTMFLRGGTQWSNRIYLHVTSSITNPQLSFLNNAATRGDNQGTIPVISFTGTFTDPVALDVVFTQFGDWRMGFWFSVGGAFYMFDLQWYIRP